jgi:acyl-coenzyme A thioesterase 13
VHGGLIMSLTDTLGSLAVASQGQYMTGVSTDISTSFVKPAGKPGDELKVTATLTAMGMYVHEILTVELLGSGRSSALLSVFLGKSLAYTRIDFTNPAGQLVAYGSEFSPLLCRVCRSLANRMLGLAHTKYIGKSIGHGVRHFFKSFPMHFF